MKYFILLGALLLPVLPAFADDFVYLKCENQMKVVDETVGAKDLSQVILTEYDKTVRYDGILTFDDLKYQEERRRRGVKKLTYEER